jgi:hypothetical protein
MKRKLSFIAIFFVVLAAVTYGNKTDVSADKNTVLKEGSKININNDYYFKYNFNKKPALGTVILKIQVFDKKDKQVKPFNIFGETGMPSMRGAHDSGLIKFKLNKKDDYLLPVNIVMPGDWDVQIIIKKGDNEIFKGSIELNI